MSDFSEPYIPQIVEDEEGYNEWMEGKNMTKDVELIKLRKKIEQAWIDYKALQDMYRYYTGKEHEWLK